MPLKQVLPVAASGSSGEDASQEQIDQIASLANNAQTVAQTAKTSADASAIKADAAKTAADGYSAQITAAGTKADNAKTAADAAAAAASAASSKADGVTATAASAETKANTAISTANTAKTTADGAKATADGLSSRVTTVETKADAAKTAADGATSAAGAASTKADAAKTAAADAKAIAVGFETRINDVESTQAAFHADISTATATANEASAAATSAKQIADNLDDQIAAAQTTANQANTTANGISATATTAKTTADAAKTAADTALTTANDTAIQAGNLQTSVTSLSSSVTLVGQKATDAQATANAASATASQLDDRIDSHDSRLEDLDDRVVTLENAAGGGTSPAYDDTAIKNRVSTLETDNTANKSAIVSLQAASGTVQLMEYLTVWGDSRTAQNWNSAGNAILARGYAFWAEALSGKVRASLKYNFGVSGDSIQQLLDRMNNDTANAAGIKPSQVPPSHAVLHIGTNSINAGTSVASCMYQLNQCITWLQNKGHTVYVVSEWPRGLTATGNSILTADNQKIMYGYAREVRKLARAKKIKIIDCWPAMGDPTLSTAQPRLNYLNGDGLHPSIGAGFLTGKLIAEALRENNARRIAYPPGSQDLYDATSNKEGSITPNPMLAGTGGTKGTNATGDVPDGWTLTPSTGLSVTSSKITLTMPDGTKQEATRLVISGTPAVNGSVMLRIAAKTRADTTGPWYGKVNDGDVIEGWGQIQVTGDFVNMSNVTCNIAAQDAANSMLGGTYTSGGTTGDLQWPDNLKQSYNAIIRSPEMTVSSAHTQFQFEIRAYFLEAIASNLTLDIITAGIRKKTPLA